MVQSAEHFFRNHAKSIKGFLLDMSGVLFNESKTGVESIPGSVEAVHRLREAGIPVRFCTNESQVVTTDIIERVNKINFGIKANEVFSPMPCIKEALLQRKLRPFLLTSKAVQGEFADVDQKDPNCVVVATSEDDFTYARVNEAFQVLMSTERPVLLAAGAGKYYRADGGLKLDLGGYTKALEYACDVKAEIIGKPTADFFLGALNDLKQKPCETVMIGDDIVNDVGGAQKCGLMGIQVRTGKFRAIDENHESVKPHCFVDDLKQAIELYLRYR